MILKPVFDEMRDFWGCEAHKGYQSQSEVDLHWWALKLDLMRCFSDQVLKKLEEIEPNGVELESILLSKQSKTEAIEMVKKIRGDIYHELQRVGEARRQYGPKGN